MENTMIRRALLALFLVISPSCGGFLGPDPPQDPETLFEIFWESYDRYYAHFELKGVDWQAVYDDQRSRVGPGTTEEELFHVFRHMIRQLEDGHVYLIAGDERAFSDAHLRGTRRNFDAEVIAKNYLGESLETVGQGHITYGTVGEEIGYIRLATLSGGHGAGDQVGGWIEDIDRAVAALSQKRGLVLDLRNNGGGRAHNTRFVAARFASEARPFLVTRSRNGPGHGDFSEPRVWTVKPSEGPRFTGPIVVLTNRHSFSAAEWLTLALREFDHVTHMGTHTGGGLAMFLPRELPNGWTYTISIQDTRCIAGRSYERVGVAPHRYVENGDDDVELGRDTTLDTAIRYLSTR
jgi:carboxyl-terminal processing protease